MQELAHKHELESMANNGLRQLGPHVLVFLQITSDQNLFTEINSWQHVLNIFL